MLGLSRSEIDGRVDAAQPFLPTSEWFAKRPGHAGDAPSRSLPDLYRLIWLGSFPAAVTPGRRCTTFSTPRMFRPTSNATSGRWPGSATNSPSLDCCGRRRREPRSSGTTPTWRGTIRLGQSCPGRCALGYVATRTPRKAALERTVRNRGHVRRRRCRPRVACGSLQAFANSLRGIRRIAACPRQAGQDGHGTDGQPDGPFGQITGPSAGLIAAQASSRPSLHLLPIKLKASAVMRRQSEGCSPLRPGTQNQRNAVKGCTRNRLCLGWSEV